LSIFQPTCTRADRHPRSPSPDLNFNRRSLKSKPLPYLINQVSLGGKMQRLGLIGEENEGRRTDGCLGDVADLDARIKLDGFQEPVQLAGGHAMRSGFVRLTDHAEQLVHV